MKKIKLQLQNASLVEIVINSVDDVEINVTPQTQLDIPRRFLLENIPTLKKTEKFSVLQQFLRKINTNRNFYSAELKAHYAKMCQALKFTPTNPDDKTNPILGCFNLLLIRKTTAYPELVCGLETILRKNENWTELENLIKSLLE